MNWDIEEHLVVEIFLDQKNIRTPISEKDQSALIQDMFENEQAMDLVKSYQENGVFPDEFPIVIKEQEKLIAIEGNRRLAALKATLVPTIVPHFEKQIKKLVNVKIKKINVVIAPNRDAAIKHIANKHTINYRRPWKPLRQAYFYKSLIDNGKPIEKVIDEYPQHNVVRFIKMLEMHKISKSAKLTDDQKVIVHDDRNFPITNLERFYEDQNVRDFLGFGFKDTGEVEINIDKGEFEKGYKKIVEDVADGFIDSRKYNTTKERKKYIDSIEEEFVPDKTKKSTSSSKDFKEEKPPVEIINRKKGRRKIATLFRKVDIPYGLKSSPLRIMYDELVQINVEKFPNATHDYLRSFLECALVTFLKETGDYNSISKNAKHNPSIGEMLQFIINGNSTKVQDSNLLAALKMDKDVFDSKYSIARMHGINHNENYTSTEKDVRKTFGLLENLFKIILNP